MYIANISNVQLIFGPVIREQRSIDCQMMKHLWLSMLLTIKVAQVFHNSFISTVGIGTGFTEARAVGWAG